jgi:FAD:protein FMN transferase
MGSTYSIKWVDAADTPEPEVLKASVDELLAAFDQDVSTWRPESHLSRFNAAPAGTCADMPASVLELIAVAESLHERSAGAFDVTIGPLMRLWGFHGSQPRQVVPADDELEATLARVGHRHLRRDGNALCKDAAVEIDLSGIGAGYMVDRVAEHLTELGITSYMVEITGELKAVGLKPGGSPWRIAIEEPRDDRRMAQVIIPLNGYGVSTSGDYRNYFEHEGQRYSHTFDPVTGRPVMHQLAAVTVLHPSTVEADGLSTVLLVKGPSEGWDYAVKNGIAALMVIRMGNGFVSRSTPQFRALKRGKE